MHASLVLEWLSTVLQTVFSRIISLKFDESDGSCESRTLARRLPLTLKLSPYVSSEGAIADRTLAVTRSAGALLWNRGRRAACAFSDIDGTGELISDETSGSGDNEAEQNQWNALLEL